MASSESETLHRAVWGTAWGPIGAILGPRGVRSLLLPHHHRDDLEKLLAWEAPGSVVDLEPFQRLIGLTRAYFNGRRADFEEIACDLSAQRTFTGRVLGAAREIPFGQTRSYGWIAHRIGRPTAVRAVAGALGRNPIPLIVPCHRVTYADGRVGGFSAPGGVALKERMLELERRA